MAVHKVNLGPLTEEMVKLVKNHMRAWGHPNPTLGDALEWIMADIKWHAPNVPAYGRFSPNLRSMLETAVKTVNGHEALAVEPEEFERSKEEITLFGGERLIGVHARDTCTGEFCAIHRPSAHSMITFRQHWRGDRGIIERICPHGIGHPDPDDYAIVSGRDGGTHGCDGCCAPLLTIPTGEDPDWIHHVV